MKEASEKVAARVKRYRERTETERLEIIGLTVEQKAAFRSLPGLEGKTSAARLQALMAFWADHHDGSGPPVQPAATPTAKPAKPEKRAETPGSDLEQVEKWRREVTGWFRTCWNLRVIPEKGTARYWHNQLKADPALREAVTAFDRRINPQFSKALKKHLITMLPQHLKAIAGLESGPMWEMVHMMLLTSRRLGVDRMIEARLLELDPNR